MVLNSLLQSSQFDAHRSTTIYRVVECWLCVVDSLLVLAELTGSNSNEVSYLWNTWILFEVALVHYVSSIYIVVQVVVNFLIVLSVKTFLTWVEKSLTCLVHLHEILHSTLWILLGIVSYATQESACSIIVLLVCLEFLGSKFQHSIIDFVLVALWECFYSLSCLYGVSKCLCLLN